MKNVTSCFVCASLVWLLSGCDYILFHERSITEVMRSIESDSEWFCAPHEVLRDFDREWISRGWSIRAIKPCVRREADHPQSDLSLTIQSLSNTTTTEKHAVILVADIRRDLYARLGPYFRNRGLVPVEHRISLTVSFFCPKSETFAYPVIQSIAFVRDRVAFWCFRPEEGRFRVCKEISLSEFFELEKAYLNDVGEPAESLGACRQEVER